MRLSHTYRQVQETSGMYMHIQFSIGVSWQYGGTIAMQLGMPTYDCRYIRDYRQVHRTLEQLHMAGLQGTTMHSIHLQPTPCTTGQVHLLVQYKAESHLSVCLSIHMFDHHVHISAVSASSQTSFAQNESCILWNHGKVNTCNWSYISSM